MSQKFGLTILMFFFALACTQEKEKKLLSQLQGQAVQDSVEAVQKADQEPNFENEINAGFSISQKGDFDLALKYYRRALARAPESAVANNDVCSTLNSLHRWVAAIPYCLAAIRQSPDFPLAKNNLQFAQSELKKQLVNLEQLKTQLAKTPENKQGPLKIDLGFEYYKMGDYPNALTVWREIKTNDPKLEVTVLNNMGAALILDRKFDQARVILNQAKNAVSSGSAAASNLSWLDQAEKEK